MRVFTAALSMLLCLPGLPGCSSLFSSPPPALVGTTWQITGLQGEAFTAPASRPFTLQLHADGHVTAYAGCNQLAGDYQLTQRSRREGVLRVGPQVQVSVVCTPAEQHLEKDVVRALEGASSYVQDEDGSLVLLNPIAIPLLRFHAVQSQSSSPRQH